MAFVSEKISEEDRKIVDSYGFINLLSKEPSNPRYWDIDRERNAFLIPIGGGGLEIPSCYAFVWNNNVTLFSLYEGRKVNELGEDEWTWEILDFLAPKSLIEKQDTLVEMIKEAFSDTMMLTEEDRCKAKYIFNFKRDPMFVLEGDDYKTRDILRGGYL